jgi:hypothetical protein
VIAVGVAAHERLGPAPLDTVALGAHRAARWQLRTGEDRVVRRWITDNAPFAFTPPTSNDRHQVEGATRLAGGTLALAYRLGDEPITLVVGAAQGGSSGPKQIVRRTDGGLEVATWTRGDRTYALVANAGRNACTLCHADAVL